MSKTIRINSEEDLMNLLAALTGAETKEPQQTFNGLTSNTNTVTEKPQMKMNEPKTRVFKITDKTLQPVFVELLRDMHFEFEPVFAVKGSERELEMLETMWSMTKERIGG